jgi:hypothetical protein
MGICVEAGAGAARKLTGICAKGVLRQGELTALQPREAGVIKVGGTAGATENDVDGRN